MTINVLWLFLAVAWVGLQCAIVVFSDHTHLLFYNSNITAPLSRICRIMNVLV